MPCMSTMTPLGWALVAVASQPWMAAPLALGNSTFCTGRSAGGLPMGWLAGAMRMLPIFQRMMRLRMRKATSRAARRRSLRRRIGLGAALSIERLDAENGVDVQYLPRYIPRLP